MIKLRALAVAAMAAGGVLLMAPLASAQAYTDPSPSVSASASVEVSVSATASATATASPSASVSATASASPSSTPSSTPPASSASPTATAPSSTPPSVSPSASVSQSTGVFFANCDDARAAGAAPISLGQPGYSPDLDSDLDGVACEEVVPASGSGRLPLTGAAVMVSVGTGVALLVAGAGLWLFSRRRRIEFAAE